MGRAKKVEIEKVKIEFNKIRKLISTDIVKEITKNKMQNNVI